MNLGSVTDHTCQANLDESVSSSSGQHLLIEKGHCRHSSNMACQSTNGLHTNSGERVIHVGREKEREREKRGEEVVREEGDRERRGSERGRVEGEEREEERERREKERGERKEGKGGKGGK